MSAWPKCALGLSSLSMESSSAYPILRPYPSGERAPTSQTPSQRRHVFDIDETVTVGDVLYATVSYSHLQVITSDGDRITDGRSLVPSVP